MAELTQKVPYTDCMIFEEEDWAPIFCKPKLLPMKTYTMEKLQEMQKEAQLQMKALEEEEEEQAKQQPSRNDDSDQGSGRSLSPHENREQSSDQPQQTQAEVWSADD